MVEKITHSPITTLHFWPISHILYPVAGRPLRSQDAKTKTRPAKTNLASTDQRDSLSCRQAKQSLHLAPSFILVLRFPPHRNRGRILGGQHLDTRVLCPQLRTDRFGGSWHAVRVHTKFFAPYRIPCLYPSCIACALRAAIPFIDHIRQSTCIQI